MRILVLIYCCALLLSRTLPAKTLILVSDEWCPYSCQPGNEQPGLLIDIATRIFAVRGYTLDYRLIPWSRALKGVREGKYHGAIALAVSDAPDFVFPTQPLALSRMCFFTTADSQWHYQGLPSLETIRLGLINDYSYGPAIDRYILRKQKKRHRGSHLLSISGTQALTKRLMTLLLKGRIDAFIESEAVMAHFLSSHPQRDLLKRAGCLAEVEELYVAFSPKDPNAGLYIRILSEGMQTLQQSGQLKRIYARYGLDDSLIPMPSPPANVPPDVHQ